MRIPALVAFVLAASVSIGHATIINFTTNPADGRVAVDTQLNALDNGDLFLVGTFSNPGAISLSLGSMDNILAAAGWSQFGQDRAVQTIGITPGRITGPSNLTTAAASAFNGLPIYIIIFNTSATNAPQAGIFRAPTVVTPGTEWLFPNYDPAGITDLRSITVDETSLTAVGGVGSVTSSPSRFVLATLVPEPTAVALLAPGVIGLLGFRRLRRSI